MSREFDSAWLTRHEARCSPSPPGGEPAGCAVESELHEQILAECRRRGWLVIHSRMDRKTTTACGTFDFIIFTDIARYAEIVGAVLLIEAKTRTGKLTVAQQALHAHARKLGHTIHVVRSFEEFLKLA